MDFVAAHEASPIRYNIAELKKTDALWPNSVCDSGNRSNKIDRILRRFNITVPVPNQNIPVQFDPFAEKLQIAGGSFCLRPRELLGRMATETISDGTAFGLAGDLYTNVVPGISFGRNPDDKR